MAEGCPNTTATANQPRLFPTYQTSAYKVNTLRFPNGEVQFEKRDGRYVPQGTRILLRSVPVVGTNFKSYGGCWLCLYSGEFVLGFIGDYEKERKELSAKSN